MWFFGSWIVPPPKKKTKSKKEPTALIGGISFCSGQQLIKNCNWSKNWEKNWVFMFSPKWDIYINLPPTAEGTSQQRDQKERKSRWMGKSSMKDGLLELAWHALVSSSRQSMFQWMEEALTTPPPHTHTTWRAIGSWWLLGKGETVFCGRLPVPLWEPTSLCILAALKDSMTYYWVIKDKKVGGEIMLLRMQKGGAAVNTIKIYTCMQFSKE